jgi:hypothetical protein
VTSRLAKVRRCSAAAYSSGQGLRALLQAEGAYGAESVGVGGDPAGQVTWRRRRMLGFGAGLGPGSGRARRIRPGSPLSRKSVTHESRGLGINRETVAKIGLSCAAAASPERLKARRGCPGEPRRSPAGGRSRVRGACELPGAGLRMPGSSRLVRRVRPSGRWGSRAG